MLPPTFVKGFHDEAVVSKMKYNDLGKTGMKVSVLGFGGASHGDLFGATKEEELIECLRHALRSGVNYIDTAPYYGNNKAEVVMGKALSGIPREAYYIATKACRYAPDGKLYMNFSAEKTLASIDASLQRLGVDYVDIIQIHDCDFASMDTLVNETLPALQKVKDAGKARFIGITGYTVSFLKEVVEKSPVKIDTVLSYSRCTMFDTTLLDFVPFFKSKGVGIVDAAGMSMGILTPNGPQDWHPADPEIKEACVKARAYCKEKGVNIAALAAYFNMSREGPATHVISCADVPVLDKNIKTAREGISEGEKKVMNEVIEKFFKRLKINNWEGLENAGYWKAQKDSGKKPEDFEGIHIDPYWKIVNSIRK